MIVNHVNVTERVARLLCPEHDCRYVNENDRIIGDDGCVYPAGVPRWMAWEEQASDIIKLVMKILFEAAACEDRE